MRRRALLATVGGGLTLAGCVDSTGVSTDGDSDASPTSSMRVDSTDVSTDPTPKPSTLPEQSNDTPTGDAMTADGVTATFQILGGHSPTDDAVEATFSDRQVTVTGSMDPYGCNEPTLESVGYDAGRIALVIGESSPYSENATVECGNASYDFRCVVKVDRTRPSVVDVTYDHPGSDDQSFTITRD